MTEDEMAGWHHPLNGHGFGWTPGVGDGQGGLACCSPWDGKRVRHDRATKLNCTALLMTLFDPSLIIVTVTFLHVKLGFPFGKC